MRQRVAYLARRTYMHVAFGVYLLFHAILPAVGLIGHHYDVLALWQRSVPVVKLLHGGEDDAA